MHKLLIALALIFLLPCGDAMASCTVTNTFMNGTTADATQVNTNFTNITNCAAPLASPGFTGNVTVTTSSGNAIDAESSATNAIIRVKTNSGGGGAYVLLDRYASANSAAINLYTNGTADWAYGTSAGPGPTDAFAVYDYGTSSTAFMIDKSTGRVGIATTSPGYTLHVNGSVAGTSAYNNLSDVRLKKNIVQVKEGLALVSRLEPVHFDWRPQSEREVGKELNLPPGKQIGFVAQDVAKVLPEAVTTANGKDAIMSVAESKIVPVLVAAVKELKATNDNQALEITHLESEVAVLQRKLGVQSAQR